MYVNEPCFVLYLTVKNEEGVFWDDGGIQQSRRKRIQLSHPSDEDTEDVKDTADTMDVTDTLV